MALPCAAAFTIGCGLIDSDVELTSPTPWCDERETGEIATVDLVQRDEDGAWVDEVITLLDAECRALTLITPNVRRRRRAHDARRGSQRRGNHPKHRRARLPRGPVPEQSSFDTDGDGTWDWIRTRTSCGPEP